MNVEGRHGGASGSHELNPTAWLVVGLLFCLILLVGLGGTGPSPIGPGRPAASAGERATSRSEVEIEHFERHADQMLQDAELVYGAEAADFDLRAFLEARPELLAEPPASSAAAIEGVARRHSIDPRTILALLSLDGAAPAGAAAERAARVAVALADGYYGLRNRRETDLVFADGRRARGPVERGAGHFAVARYLARLGAPDGQAARQAGFAEHYAELFGEAKRLRPPVPADLVQPPLLLPWDEGQRWHYTGGPHGAWGVSSAWGAVDFAPPSLVGCRAAPEKILAAAPGMVTWSRDGLVLVDLDGDGNEGTGWVLAYLHVAGPGRVEEGRWLQAGDPIGHPSCEGGVADGAHVHFARRFNGEWLPAAEGVAPLQLSGWAFRALGAEYDGSMLHPEQGQRNAVTSRRGGETGVVSDNGASRRAELADAWASLRREPLSPGVLADAASPYATGLPFELSPSQDPTPGSARRAAGGAEQGARLRIRLRLRGRRTQASPVLIGLRRGDQTPVVLMARSDESGRTPAIDLPPGVKGHYDLSVRAPGFAPGHAFGVELGQGLRDVDLSLDGRVELAPGEFDGDDRVGFGDLRAWVHHWRAGREIADLDGDGRAGLGDGLSLLWSLAAED